MDGETGVGWWYEPGLPPVYLIVDGGKVIGCTPYAAPWALDRTAAQLLARGERDGVRVEWIPCHPAPTLFQPHLVAGKHPYRRWRRDRRPLAETHLTFGSTPHGWFVFDTDEPHAWLYAEPGQALAECRRRMRTGTWRRVNRQVGEQVGDDEPGLPDGLED